ncbi:MAG: D-2-hydroxyacid dehydrogenase [Clostridia bacterium]
MTLILCPRELDESIFEKISNISEEVKLIASEDESIIEKYWPKMDILFSGRLDAEKLNKAKNLKWIQATSAGVDYYMFDEFIDSDVKLTNVRGMHGQTISEHVLMMMLAISRNLTTAMENKSKKIWDRYQADLICDKKLVIVGLGGIGQKLAELANKLGIEVIGVDINDPKLPYVEKVYHTKNIKEALSIGDFVVIATPLTEETYHMISNEEFEAMQNSATFINIARGKIVDQDALYKALSEKEISNAAIDVFEKEPLEKDSPLWDLDNIIITPHVAGTMPEYMDNASDIFIKNLKRFLEDKELINLVDKSMQF